MGGCGEILYSKRLILSIKRMIKSKMFLLRLFGKCLSLYNKNCNRTSFQDLHKDVNLSANSAQLLARQ